MLTTLTFLECQMDCAAHCYHQCRYCLNALEAIDKSALWQDQGALRSVDFGKIENHYRNEHS